MNTNASPEQYRALINEAYRLEDEGDLSAALDRLDEALEMANDPHVVTTLDEHLHRPHLLQRLGRLDEARRDFQRLLDEGYPDQLSNDSVRWIETGLIYNAMRRAFARADRAAEAAIYEGLSYLADAYGRMLDPDRETGESTPPLSRATIDAVAETMVSSVPEGPCAAEVAAVLQDTAERFDEEDGRTLLDEAEAALRRLFDGAA